MKIIYCVEKGIGIYKKYIILISQAIKLDIVYCQLDFS